MNNFRQLKERRLVQIVFSYLAAGWIGLEVVSSLVDRGTISPLAWNIALVWFVGGLAAALLIGWYHGERGNQKAPLAEMVTLALVGFAVVSLSGWSVYGHVARVSSLQEARESALKLNRVAVLYFDDLSSDGSARYLADGLTEGLIDQLSSIRELDVISRGGVEPFRGTAVGYDSIGAALEAGTLVAGSVEPTGTGFRVALQIVDQSGNAFERATFDIPADELNRADETVVGEASRLLRGWLGDEVRLRRTQTETESVAAWALYHRAEKARKDAETAALARDAAAMTASFDEADSLLILAHQADSEWDKPHVLGAFVAYRRSRTASTPDELERWIEIGLERVRSALALDENNARAIELRGTLKYWRWLRVGIPDPEEARQLFEEAQRDFERAVDLDPGLASAYASLTHVYFNVPDFTGALIAGQRAYEEDAYLENPHLIVKRNFDASYNLEQFTEGRRWCEIGQQRFPDNYYFTLCELLLMTTRAVEPDPDRAWELLARIDSLAPEYQAEWEHLRSRMLVGGVLARANLVDSANAVWTETRRRRTPENDPALDIPFVEAYMRTLAGDDDTAIDLLKRVAAGQPDADFDSNWWWRDLRDHPRWRELAQGR